MRRPLGLRPSHLLGLALFLPGLGRPAPSRADIPPEPGYVEQCTVEKVQKKGEFCSSCRAWHGDRDVCDRTFGSDTKLKWKLRCHTRGASVWSEIWCAPWNGRNPPVIPQTPPKQKDRKGPVF